MNVCFSEGFEGLCVNYVVHEVSSVLKVLNLTEFCKAQLQDRRARLGISRVGCGKLGLEF